MSKKVDRVILQCVSHDRKPNLATCYGNLVDAAMVQVRREIPDHKDCKIVVVKPRKNSDTAYDEILAETPGF